MNFDEYQEKALSTAIYPNKGDNFIYPVLGLVGEAGEVAEKIKKVIRDNNGVITSEKRSEIGAEISDVLWYLAAVADELGFSLSEVATINLEKLASRQERGKLGGSGDNR